MNRIRRDCKLSVAIPKSSTPITGFMKAAIERYTLFVNEAHNPVFDEGHEPIGLTQNHVPVCGRGKIMRDMESVFKEGRKLKPRLIKTSNWKRIRQGTVFYDTLGRKHIVTNCPVNASGMATFVRQNDNCTLANGYTFLRNICEYHWFDKSTLREDLCQD